jgi:hypothetical protein
VLLHWSGYGPQQSTSWLVRSAHQLFNTQYAANAGESPGLAVTAAQESDDALNAVLRQKVEALKRDGVTAEFVPSGMTMRGAAHAIAEFARDQGLI